MRLEPAPPLGHRGGLVWKLGESVSGDCQGGGGGWCGRCVGRNWVPSDEADVGKWRCCGQNLAPFSGVGSESWLKSGAGERERWRLMGARQPPRRRKDLLNAFFLAENGPPKAEIRATHLRGSQDLRWVFPPGNLHGSQPNTSAVERPSKRIFAGRKRTSGSRDTVRPCFGDSKAFTGFSGQRTFTCTSPSPRRRQDLQNAFLLAENGPAEAEIRPEHVLAEPDFHLARPTFP